MAVVRRRLYVVVDLHPVEVQLAVLQHPVLLDGVVAWLFRQQAMRQFPDFLGMRAVLGVGHHHVGRQAMREGADLARGAAGRWLPGQRERAVAGLGDFSGQQMDVVDHLVGPHAADMLVESHGPERHDLALGIGIELCKLLEEFRLHAGQFDRLFERVVRHERLEFIEVDRLHLAGVGRAGRGCLQRMFGPEAIADIGRALHEGGVVAHERLVDAAGRDDVVGDVVEDCEIRARLEDDRHVGQIHAAMREGRQHRDPHMRVAEPSVRQPRPQDRVHLGHVRAPQHERVGVLEIVVAAHRLVHAEGAHEGVGGGRHAVTRIGIEIVGAEAGPHQLGRGIAFEDRPLAGAEHADCRRSLLLQHLLALFGHHVEGLVPGDRLELAFLVEDAVALAQKRRGQPIGAVHDLGQEIALDAVEAAIDLGLHVAVGGDDLALLDADHDAAAGAAEAAWRLRPFDLERAHAAGNGLGGCRQRNPCSRRGNARGMGFQDVAPRQIRSSLSADLLCLDMFEHHVRGDDPVEQRDPGETVSHHPRARALDDDDDLAAFMAMHLDVAAWLRDAPGPSSAIAGSTETTALDM